jgi:hypothetical protein
MTMQGTPWQLGVRCDSPDCGANFEGDFMVAEDSTRIERLGVVLHWVEQRGWRVIWDQPIWDSRTYCPDCCRPAEARTLPARNGHDPAGTPQEHS